MPIVWLGSALYALRQRLRRKRYAGVLSDTTAVTFPHHHKQLRYRRVFSITVYSLSAHSSAIPQPPS